MGLKASFFGLGMETIQASFHSYSRQWQVHDKLYSLSRMDFENGWLFLIIEKEMAMIPGVVSFLLATLSSNSSTVNGWSHSCGQPFIGLMDVIHRCLAHLPWIPAAFRFRLVDADWDKKR